MIYSSIIADAPVSNTAAEMAIFSQAVPVSLFSPGRVLRTEFWGIYSALALGPTITMRLRYGTSVASSTVLAGAVTTALVAASVNLGYNALVYSTVRATGASGSIFTQGKLEYEIASGVQNAAWVKASAAVSINLSSDANLFATIQFSGANVSNVVLGTNATLSIE